MEVNDLYISGLKYMINTLRAEIYKLEKELKDDPGSFSDFKAKQDYIFKRKRLLDASEFEFLNASKRPISFSYGKS